MQLALEKECKDFQFTMIIDFYVSPFEKKLYKYIMHN